MRDSGVPLAALPNIGLASIVGGRVVYPHSTPEYFGDFAAQAAALGARIVGGCCGTTPAQIEAIRAALDDERAPRAAFEARELAEEPLPIPAVGETRLARALREGEWVVSVELDPPKGGTNEAMIEVARMLRQSGAVGFVDVNDNPMARARMNALDGVDRDPARGRHRDDPPCHAARHDGDGARGSPPRRPRRRRAEHPRGDGRPAARRRLPRLARRVRDRLDRPRPAARGPQPGGRLRRQGDRPADVVLHRGRREPDRRRSRPRARAVRAQGRVGRAASR